MPNSVDAFVDRVRREAEAARHRIRPCALSAIEAQIPREERGMRGREIAHPTIHRIVTGLSPDTLARISCWNTAQRCGHSVLEHEAVVESLLQAGWGAGLSQPEPSIGGGASTVADETLKRVERIERRIDPDSSFGLGRSDVAWLCQQVRELLAERDALTARVRVAVAAYEMGTPADLDEAMNALSKAIVASPPAGQEG